MRNRKSHVVTIKKKLEKCKTVFHAYNDIQLKYGEELDKRNDIKEIKCNIGLSDFSLGDTYTSDFYCIKKDGTVFVRECVLKERLLKPSTIELMDASRNYWLSRGIKDWGIVLND